MNILFAIGGLVVLAGITYMTFAYFQQAKELKETQKRLEEALMDIQLLESRLESRPKHYINLDPTYEALQNMAEAIKNLKFGDF